MSAAFSPCRKYRYTLTREWIGGDGYVMFIGLNPSTADATNDDPTIRRCINFAKAWGYSGLVMTNLFAYRSTDPIEMMNQQDAVGPLNDEHLMWHSKLCRVIVAAWGVHGQHRQRDEQVRAMFPNLHVLKLTKDGHPGHPLYLPKSLKPVMWQP